MRQRKLSATRAALVRLNHGNKQLSLTNTKPTHASLILVESTNRMRLRMSRTSPRWVRILSRTPNNQLCGFDSGLAPVLRRNIAYHSLTDVAGSPLLQRPRPRTVPPLPPPCAIASTAGTRQPEERPQRARPQPEKTQPCHCSAPNPGARIRRESWRGREPTPQLS